MKAKLEPAAGLPFPCMQKFEFLSMMILRRPPPLINPYLHSIPLPLLLVFHDTYNINYVRVGLPGISSVKYNSVKHTVLTVLMRLTLAYAENIKKNRKIKCSSWNSHSELYGVEFMSLAKQFFI